MKHRILLWVLLLTWFSPALCEEMDVNKGRILLAGLVHAPMNQNDGGSEVAEGIGGVPGVKVEIVGAGLSTTTNRNGMFYFTKCPSGKLRLSLSKPGYRTQTRDAEVDTKSFDPPMLSVEMLPDGMQSQGRILSGTGVLYIAYAPAETPPEDQGGMPIFELLKELVAGKDPIAVPQLENPDPEREQNPYTIALSHLMVYPPATPSRSSFKSLSTAPYYLTFDGTGRYLYLADETFQIKVYDEDREHELVGTVVLPQGSRVTSLRSTADGRTVLATLMSASPGVLLIDSSSMKALAYLPVDGLANAVLKDAVLTSNGTLLMVAGAPGQPGLFLSVDPHTGAVLQRLVVGQMPVSLAVDARNEWAYVSNSQSASISVIDLKTGSLADTLSVGVGPQQLALSPDQTRLVVANQGADTLTVIEPRVRRVVGTVKVGKGPSMMAISSDSKLCYVANRDGHNVSTVDLVALKETHVTDPMPRSRPFQIVLRP